MVLVNSNAIYKAAAIFAMACVVGPPVLKVVLTAITQETLAEAQTYGNVPAGSGTVDLSGRVLPNGTMNPRAGEMPASLSGYSKRVREVPAVIPPNGCMPGQVPLLPGAGCPPNAGACLAPLSGSVVPRVPCGPAPQSLNAAAAAQPNLPPSAVQ